jgi:hypothetical protein
MTSAARPILVSMALVVAFFAGDSNPARASDLCGTWEGRWQSCTDQFQGTVKAKIARCDATHYKAVFTGRAFKIMPYRYTATLIACQDTATGKIRFRCTRKLPFWGCYWMHGTVDGCCLFSRYRTDDHTGYFKMHRVGSK